MSYAFENGRGKCPRGKRPGLKRPRGMGMSVSQRKGGPWSVAVLLFGLVRDIMSYIMEGRDKNWSQMTRD